MSKTYNYIVKPGQNLVDVAMQEYGSAEAIVSICNDNGLDVGQDISAGTNLIMNEENVIDKKLVAYYKKKEITVSSE